MSRGAVSTARNFASISVAPNWLGGSTVRYKCVTILALMLRFS
jgi:hypothetical protein